jgi:hypothetical protein
MLRSRLKEKYHHLSPKHSSACSTDWRLPINMTTSSEEHSPFLRLPAELRIAIYNFLKDDCITTISTISDQRHSVSATRIPASYDVAKYSGFIMSCRLIFSVFENEWVPASSKYVRAIIGSSPIFQAPKIARLSDSMPLQIAVSEPEAWSEELLRNDFNLLRCQLFV